jgi:DNA/RNA-binding domain of Phe-tRNA-synthetase-like protein
MLVGGGAVAITHKTKTLLDELAALDPARRRELAAALRSVAETFAEVSDGKTARHVLGVLSRLLDPP